MKVTCPICHTEKFIKDEKLFAYRGKTISTKCANKSCTHRIKFRVPADLGMDKTATEEKSKPKEKPSKQVVKDNQEPVHCPQCNSPVTPGLKFCPNCGAKLFVTENPIQKKPDKGVIHCKKCNTIVPDNANFCLKCGTPVADTTTKIKQETTKENSQINTPKAKATETDKPKKNPGQSTLKKPVVTPETKPKKGGCLKKIVIFLIILLILGILSVIAGYLWIIQQENVLADGPWTTETYIQKELYSKTKYSNIKQWNKAAREVNAAYKAFLDSTSVTCPQGLQYKKNDGTYFLNQYHPVKKNSLYFFTISEPENNAKMNVVLELKSKNYFEGKAFFVSKDQILESYIIGHLKE